MALVTASTLAQCRTLLPVLAIYFALGLSIGWGSPALYKLRNSDVPFSASPNEISWIASIFDIGILVGTVVGGLTLNRLGRRYTVLLVPITLVIWSMLTFFARSVVYLMVARFSGGMALAVNCIFNPIYIAEVSTPAVRGPLTLIGACLFMSGSIVQYAVGPNVDWETMNIVGMPPSILALVLAFFLLEESPYFYAITERYDDMTTSLMRLRGATSEEEVKAEASSMQAHLAEQMGNSTSLRKIFAEPGNRRAAIIVLTIQGAMSISGNGGMMTFGQIIFKETGSVLSDDISVIVMFAAQMLGLAISLQLVNTAGRRPLLTYTFTGCGLCIAGVTIFLFLKEVVHTDMSSVLWVPLVLLVLYRFSSGLGAYTVPEVLAGEILDQPIKTLVGPMGMIIFSVPAFIVSNLFVRIQDSVGMYVIFIIFSAANLFAGLFCAIMVPETKGKTLLEVQDMLRGRTHSSLSRMPLNI